MKTIRLMTGDSIPKRDDAPPGFVIIRKFESWIPLKILIPGTGILIFIMMLAIANMNPPYIRNFTRIFIWIAALFDKAPGNKLLIFLNWFSWIFDFFLWQAIGTFHEMVHILVAKCISTPDDILYYSRIKFVNAVSLETNEPISKIRGSLYIVAPLIVILFLNFIIWISIGDKMLCIPLLFSELICSFRDLLMFIKAMFQLPRGSFWYGNLIVKKT